MGSTASAPATATAPAPAPAPATATAPALSEPYLGRAKSEGSMLLPQEFVPADPQKRRNADEGDGRGSVAHLGDDTVRHIAALFKNNNRVRIGTSKDRRYTGVKPTHRAGKKPKKTQKKK
jgi:hypothetical protein